jgi:negative regulator of replication initiation
MRDKLKSRAIFELGQIYSTRGAHELLTKSEIINAIERHVSGDRGDICPEDAAENEFAIDKYLRILSVYHREDGTKFWIITEADRSATTILLPDEY